VSARHRYSNDQHAVCTSISQEVNCPDRRVNWCGDVSIEELKTHHDKPGWIAAKCGNTGLVCR